MMDQSSGTYINGVFLSRGIKPNLRVEYTVYLPTATPKNGKYALLFSHDGSRAGTVEAAERLMQTGAMPPTVVLGAVAGYLMATLDGGIDRRMRMDNYDIFDPAFPDFVVDELIPYVAKTHGISISENPDLHMAFGGSSGGISSWNLAWFRTDYFHRVYMSSPSFLSMGNGREMPALIRKCETKPIRVWVEYSENEPDDYFGSSLAAAIDAVRALRFAGYDMQDRYFAGEGHCSRERDVENLCDAFTFLWKNWETEPVTAPRSSPRFERVFVPNTRWEIVTDCKEKSDRKTVECPSLGGCFVERGCEILWEKDGVATTVANFFGEISAMGLSCDGWRIYVASRTVPCVYAMNVLPDGRLEGGYLHGSIHTYTAARYVGVTDLCVDAHDRIFAATECGIQSIRPFGLIDVIAPMPSAESPKLVSIENREDGAYLAVLTEKGNCYERPLCAYSETLASGVPFPTAYYD